MKITHERDLESIAAKDPTTYESFSLAALVVYSLYWLHEWELRRSIEAITVLSWRLFPTKFSMVGWPQYPDAIRAQRSLLQCRPKYRNWVTGAAVKGFSLNERGMQVAQELLDQLGSPSTTKGEQFAVAVVKRTVRPKPSQARTIEPAREVEAARQSRLFEKWSEGVMTERDLIHVHSLLDIFEHTPAKLREKRMKDLERAAADVNDSEMIDFLSEVRRSFPPVFNRVR